MSREPATSKKATWLGMTIFIAAVLTVAVLKARPKWERAASGECRARLMAIGGLLQAWKGANPNRFPPDLESLRSLTRAAPSPRWTCPADSAGQSSYEFVFPSANDYDKTAVFVRCQRHGHICRADGSVSAAIQPKD